MVRGAAAQCLTSSNYLVVIPGNYSMECWFYTFTALCTTLSILLLSRTAEVTYLASPSIENIRGVHPPVTKFDGIVGRQWIPGAFHFWRRGTIRSACSSVAQFRDIVVVRFVSKAEVVEVSVLQHGLGVLYLKKRAKTKKRQKKIIIQKGYVRQKNKNSQSTKN